jgi:hypothetical protein
MENLARRTFCGTVLAGLPLLYLHANEIDDPSDDSDPVVEALSDEFYRVTAEGAQAGYRSEHFRRYAGIIRTFDVHLEAKGVNREFNRRLDDDDSSKINPLRSARHTVQYWEKHGIYFNENDIASRLRIDPAQYRAMKMRIKREGGIRVLNKGIINALEKRANENETIAFKGGAVFQNGRLIFPSKISRTEFMNVQIPFDISPNVIIGINMDCLCKALIASGVFLEFLSLMACPVCAIAGSIYLALEKLLESFKICDPQKC